MQDHGDGAAGRDREDPQVGLRGDPRARLALGDWGPNDLPRLRRYWRKVERDLGRERRRRRELEHECERLQAVVVELVVRWYDPGERRPPRPFGGDLDHLLRPPGADETGFQIIWRHDDGGEADTPPDG